MSRLPITESDLHAYADDLLSASRRQEVDNYLTAQPEEMARVQAWRSQNDALRELFDPVLDEPVPQRLRMDIDARVTTGSNAGIDAAVHRRPARFGPAYFGRYAAALLIALAGGIAGWMLHGASQPSATLTVHAGTEAPLQVAALAHQAAVAHAVYSPDVRRPVEVAADDEDALVKWLSKRIGTPLHPPRLGKLGYELMGGRLLPGQNGPVAQFMYQDAGGQRLTLYVSTDQEENADTGFRFAQEGTVNVFYWIDGKFGYALSGGVDKGTLATIANAVYEQLDVPR